MTSCQVTTDAVLEGSIQWQEHYRNHDFKALAALYTEDCKVYPPGRPVGIGRAGEWLESCYFMVGASTSDLLFHVLFINATLFFIRALPYRIQNCFKRILAIFIYLGISTAILALGHGAYLTLNKWVRNKTNTYISEKRWKISSEKIISVSKRP